MMSIIRNIVAFLLLALKAWVVVCASAWFWPQVGLTFPIIIAILIIFNMVRIPELVLTAFGSVSSLMDSTKVKDMKDDEQKMVAKMIGWGILGIDLVTTLSAWLILWILFLIM